MRSNSLKGLKIGEANQVPKGRVRLFASGETVWSKISQDGEILAQTVGQSARIYCGEGEMIRPDAPKGVQAFVHWPDKKPLDCQGEIFTSVERRPHSAAYDAALGASRRERMMLQQMRKEAYAALSEMRRLTAQPSATAPVEPPAAIPPSTSPPAGTEPAA